MTPHRALARTLVADPWPSAIGHLVMLALVIALAGVAVPARVLVPWSAAIVVLVATRAVWSYRARMADAEPAALMRTTRLLMTALGLAWGVGTAMAAAYLPPGPFSIIAMALAGLLAGAINTLVGDRWAFPLYALGLFGPTLLVDVLRMSGRESLIEAALIVLFLLFMGVLHSRAHDTLGQRLRMEDDLRQRERQLASAQTIAHVGSWEWDLITNVVTWSDELRRVYGVAPDAPAGYAEFLKLAHPDDRPRLEALVAEVARTHQAMEYEWRAVRPDGTTRHILGRNIVMTDQRGQAIRMAGTSFDITERKLAEEEVKVLQGILPICASCKRIKNEAGGWEAVESFVRERTHAEFSHGLCPDCAKRDWG